ncbi:MAG TPA: TMEM175 family protein [Longimicrobium sp.]|nr:TMEM175 family protein [Longimicrobium sp.]
MIRQHLMGNTVVERNGFRWRAREVSRLEALSDAVFGFAITLLVVSLEVPGTADELFTAMRGFVPFAACFALLFLVWYNQYRFFRRYGLNDNVTVALNAALLFVVLFFVYPLKFVFGLAVAMITGASATPVPVVEPGQWPWVMVIFSGGYIAVFGLFALLHVHAWRKRGELELNEVEVFDTVDNVRESLLNVAVAVVSVLLAVFGGEMGAFLAGMVYWLVGPIMTINGFAAARARKRLTQRLAAG